MTDPTEPIRPSRDRRLTAWIVGTVLTLVVAGACVGGLAYLNRDPAPAPAPDHSTWCDANGDITHADPGTDECIGVSDRSFDHVFLSEYAPLKTVQAAIARENKAVTADAVTSPANYYVDIAYVMPLPWHGLGLGSLARATHELEGAYIRQSINNELTQPGHPPRIRLLVANPGYDLHDWQTVAKQLTDLKAKGRLVAVTGLGPSLTTTADLLASLGSAGIATLGTDFTADTLHGQLGGAQSVPVRRISPANQEEIAAALHFIAADRSGKRTVLVAAGDPDNVDVYTKTLIEAFQQQNTTPTDLEFYDPGSPAFNATLDNIASRICNSTDVGAVYFAGRSTPAAHLTGEIGKRCGADRRVKVYTGDDVTAQLSTVPAQNDEWTTLRTALNSGKVELLFTGLASPDQWGGQAALANAQELTKLADRIGRLPHIEAYPLDDGDAMLAYDSVMVLSEVIAQVATGIGRVDPPITDLQRLNNGFFGLTTRSPVCGTSGPIALVRDDNELHGQVGNTINKPIPLVRIVVSPDRTQLKAQFQQLYYPGGAKQWSGQCGFPS